MSQAATFVEAQLAQHVAADRAADVKTFHTWLTVRWSEGLGFRLSSTVSHPKGLFWFLSVLAWCQLSVLCCRRSAIAMRF